LNCCGKYAFYSGGGGRKGRGRGLLGFQDEGRSMD